MVALSNIAQGSAAFAMMILSKNDEKLKGLSLTSGISAWLGIIEPAMFGVNLRFRFAFISAIIGSAIAGVVISVAGVKAASIGIGGIPAPLSIVPGSWGPFMIGMVIVIVVPFLLTLVLGQLQKKRA
jgi:PTS system trehalose-specific IIC component